MSMKPGLNSVRHEFWPVSYFVEWFGRNHELSAMNEQVNMITISIYIYIYISHASKYDKGTDYKIPYMGHTKTTHYCCWHSAIYIYVYIYIYISSNNYQVCHECWCSCYNVVWKHANCVFILEKNSQSIWLIWLENLSYTVMIHPLYYGLYEQTDGNIYRIEFDDLFRLILN